MRSTLYLHCRVLRVCEGREQHAADHVEMLRLLVTECAWHEPA